MTIADRISAFDILGKRLDTIDDEALNSVVERAYQRNTWFVEKNVKQALTGVRKFLQQDTLRQWLSGYRLAEDHPNVIGLVLAGNLPLVGFHDILAVLISGNHALIKPSSKDDVLIRFMLDELTVIEPRFKEAIAFADRLNDFDAIIATGGDNTSRYFEYYFGKYPHIIRKNRTSCAIINGNEAPAELSALGHDVLDYFGLGCRNVSKLFVPEGYLIHELFDNWNEFREIAHHHKYYNNYEYQKAIHLVNGVPFLDNGFLIMTENEKIVSPIAVVYYEFYQDKNDLQSKLDAQRAKIQCIIGNETPATIAFGQAQMPTVTDYADHVDTIKFLEELGTKV